MPKKIIPVIDLFAGPGGLSEGFHQANSSKTHEFQTILSIEKDPQAHKTLKFRSFWRKVSDKNRELEAFSLLPKVEIEKHVEALYKNCNFIDLAIEADNEALNFELSPKNRLKLEKEIETRLNKSGSNDFVLIGGPPCQAFSIAGRAKNLNNPNYVPEKDLRHFLYLEYLHVISKFSPAVFVMENVKGMLSAKISGESIFLKILADLRSPLGNKKSVTNYELFSLTTENPADPEDFIVKAEEFGIPQKRHRVIIVGIRSDIAKKIKPKIVLKKEENTVTIQNAIGDLPKIRSGLSKNDSLENWINTINSLEKKMTPNQKIEPRLRAAINSEIKNIKSNKLEKKSHLCTSILSDLYFRKKLPNNLIANHESRTHMGDDLLRYFYASIYAKTYGISPKLNDFISNLLPNHKNIKSGIFSDRFRVQVAKEPSNTIVSHISKDGHYYIHPDPFQCRSLTVREAARIQTFPDDYIFLGTRTSQYSQVGNAVPPLLAKKIASQILKLFS